MAAAASGPLAANSGVLTWFQFNGNTYLVENVNLTSASVAHPDVQASDVIVELAGLVAVNAHGAFGANGIFTV
jgi:hypothetical protein